MTLLIYLMILHFVADFLLQPRKMGKKKSTEVLWLFGHVTIQFVVFFFGLLFYKHNGVLLPMESVVYFAFWNALIHMGIDGTIWNLYKVFTVYRAAPHIPGDLKKERKVPLEEREAAFKKWKNDFKYWEDHWFYVTIGLDQLLHVTTIVLLYQRFFS